MKLEVNYAWLSLLLSLLILLFLWPYKLFLSLYALSILLLLSLRLWILPRRALRAEPRFIQELLRLVSGGEAEQAEVLIDKQWLIRRFGRAFILEEQRALLAKVKGKHEESCQRYRTALKIAPAEAQLRLRLNLAQAELSAGRLERAEALLRQLLKQHPGFGQAQLLLAEILERGDQSG